MRHVKGMGMGTHKLTALVAGLALLPISAIAECGPPPRADLTDIAIPAAPPPADLALRPELPECLQGLSAPNQENCSADEIRAYADAVDAWDSTLRSQVGDADAYANAAAAAANTMIGQAEAARRFADATFAWAQCEAEEVRAQEN